MNHTIRLSDLTWKDVKSLIDEGYTRVVFGIGATEQHGPALPLQTDAKQADTTAEMIATNLPKTLMAPTIQIGYSAYHLAFAGTISLRKHTLQAIIEDYIDSLVHHGFKTVIIFISHGGNVEPTLTVLQQKRMQYSDIQFIHYYDQNAMAPLGALCLEFQLTAEQLGTHAGDMEASIMSYLTPDLVHTDRFSQGFTDQMTENLYQEFHNKGIEILSPLGIIGDQQRASAEKGEKYIATFKNVILDYIKAQLKDL